MKVILTVLSTVLIGIGASACFMFDMPLVGMALSVLFLVMLPVAVNMIDKQDREDRNNFSIRRGYYGEKIHNFSGSGGWKGV